METFSQPASQHDDSLAKRSFKWNVSNTSKAVNWICFWNATSAVILDIQDKHCFCVKQYTQQPISHRPDVHLLTEEADCVTETCHKPSQSEIVCCCSRWFGYWSHRPSSDQENVSLHCNLWEDEKPVLHAAYESNFAVIFTKIFITGKSEERFPSFSSETGPFFSRLKPVNNVQASDDAYKILASKPETTEPSGRRTSGVWMCAAHLSGWLLWGLNAPSISIQDMLINRCRPLPFSCLYL